jgi:cyclophilin family peptidyl-prolyl cis-trans isomerase
MQFDAPENQGLTGTVSATLNTSCGPIEFSLDASKYPQTVNSFVFLARKGYFDGTVCHRLAKGFVLQCGDPTAIGIGGPGYTVPDEFPPDGFVYQKGVVAMANAGPGTTGSQFFIVLGDAGFLDPTFSILGNVIGSEDTLAKLDSVPVGMTSGVQPEESSPLETIYLDSVTIAG